MQSASAKSALHSFLLKQSCPLFFLPALELLQKAKVLHGSLTYTVVISQSRLASCPTKHKLPRSLQLFHSNTAVINTANNRSNPFYVSALSAGKGSIAPSSRTSANYRAWKETVREIRLPSARSFTCHQRKEKAPKTLNINVLSLKIKDSCCL